MDDKQVRLPSEIDISAPVSLSAGSPLSSALEALGHSVDTLVDAQGVDLTTEHDGDEELEPALHDVRRAIQRVCVSAHERHLRAEQVIVLVKQTCGGSLAGTSRRRKSDRGATLNGIITAFITEFYASTAENATTIAGTSNGQTLPRSSRLRPT